MKKFKLTLPQKRLLWCSALIALLAILVCGLNLAYQGGWRQGYNAAWDTAWHKGYNAAWDEAWLAGYNGHEPVVIVETEIITVVEEKEIEVIRVIPGEARDFYDLRELHALMIEWRSHLVTLFNEKPTGTDEFDCDDIAKEFRNFAYERGYYCGYFVLVGYRHPQTNMNFGFHVFNSAIVGNDLYYISAGDCWKVMHLD